MFSRQLLLTVLAFTVFMSSILVGVVARADPDNAALAPVVRKNPYKEVRWDRVHPYLANFHSHTVYSDGQAEPDQLIYNYARAGYAILAIADHDNYQTHRDGERHVAPTHETTWPWTRWISEQPSKIWTRNGMETTAFFPDLGEHGMLAIRRNELSSHPHMVSLFNDCGFPDMNQTDAERLDCIQSKGGLAYWAHPSLYVPPHGWQYRFFQSSFDQAIRYYGEQIAKYDCLLGVEFNQNDLDARMPEPVKVFDALLQMLYKDHDVFVFGSDDTHATTVADNATLTIVLAEELTEQAVRRALQKGHTLVGQRTSVYPELRQITVRRLHEQQPMATPLRFLESPEGLEVLRRLLAATHLVFLQGNDCGIRDLCAFLERLRSRPSALPSEGRLPCFNGYRLAANASIACARRRHSIDAHGRIPRTKKPQHAVPSSYCGFDLKRSNPRLNRPPGLISMSVRIRVL